MPGQCVGSYTMVISGNSCGAQSYCVATVVTNDFPYAALSVPLERTPVT